MTEQSMIAPLVDDDALAALEAEFLCGPSDFGALAPDARPALADTLETASGQVVTIYRTRRYCC